MGFQEFPSLRPPLWGLATALLIAAAVVASREVAAEEVVEVVEVAAGAVAPRPRSEV